MISEVRSFIILFNNSNQLSNFQLKLFNNKILTEKLNLLNHPNITQEHITMMIHKLLVAQDMNLVDNFGHDTHTNWNFFNSFFFAITVITTVGYGHLSPSTISGRIFCLAYALFGIPMTGILLGAIGERFSRCFLDQVYK